MSKDQLIAVATSQLHMGSALRYTLRDEVGRVLLAKGLKIDNLQTLEMLQARRHVYVSLDESEEGTKLLIAGLNELTRQNAAIKDFDKYVPVKVPEGEAQLTGSLNNRWQELESKLDTVLKSTRAIEALPAKMDWVHQAMLALLAEDRDGSLFLQLHQAVTGYAHYSTHHALLCATLCHLLSGVFSLQPAHSESLVRAALTMNLAMTLLQDQLALQVQATSPAQRELINQHAARSRDQLAASGITDALWLDVVALHHTPLDPATSLKDRTSGHALVHILQTVDRYTAAMSPRKSRAGRSARDSVRSVIVQAGVEKHDEVGTALMQLLGLSPAGTYVKLVNGETAVVLRRGIKPNEPYVASVINRDGDVIAEPRLHNTAREGFQVSVTIAASSVRLRLNTEVMLRLLARSKTTVSDSLPRPTVLRR